MTDVIEPTVIDATESAPAECLSRTAVLTADQLTAEESEYVSLKIDAARRSVESSIRYHEEWLAKYRSQVDTVAEDHTPTALRFLTAKRLLAAAGIDFAEGWCDNLIVRLGHLRQPEADRRLADLSRTLGAFDPDNKTVDVTEHNGRKVLSIVLPSKRWPVEVRYTTPSSKKYACRIVADVRHSVVCTPVDD